MNELIYGILSYVVELSKLLIVCIAIMGLITVGKKRVWSSAILSLALVVGLKETMHFDKDILFFLIGCIAILSVTCALQQKKDIVIVILAYIWICNIDIVILCLCQYTVLLGNSVSQPIEIGINSISLVLFVAVYLWLRKRKDFFLFSVIPKRYLILITIGCLAIGMYTSSLELFAAQESYNLYVRKAILWVMMGSLIFVVVGIIFIKVLLNIHKVTYEKKYQKYLMESQEKYYVSMMDKMEDTKKFRHDIREHLYCMQVLLQDKKYMDLEEYFNKINGTFQELDVGIKTGVRIVDVIVNDLSKQFKEVKIEWSGLLNENIALDQVSACTVFYNLLKNALEAAILSKEKNVTVSVKQLEKKTIIIIENSYEQEPHIVGEKIVTTKTEDGHGYGLINVKTCLQNIGGIIQYEYADMVFKVRLIIPVK